MYPKVQPSLSLGLGPRTILLWVNTLCYCATLISPKRLNKCEDWQAYFKQCFQNSFSSWLGTYIHFWSKNRWNEYRKSHKNRIRPSAQYLLKMSQKILFWFLALKINPLTVKVTLYEETSQYRYRRLFKTLFDVPLSLSLTDVVLAFLLLTLNIFHSFF